MPWRANLTGADVAYMQTWTLDPFVIAAATDVVYFASGSNSPGEILGFDELDVPYGVAIDHVSPSALYLLQRARTEHLFVDSGAYSEVEFHKDGPPTVQKLITHDEWVRRLAMYDKIARALGPRCWLVAPDMIGNQEVTLDRLQRYGHHVRRFARMGANIIAPVQKGVLSMFDFYRFISETLGFEPTPGIPMKKDATTLEAVVEFLAELQPPTVHLLGLGPKRTRKRPTYATVIKAVREVAPNTAILCDSVLVASIVGRGKNKKNPRIMTAVLDELMVELAEDAYHDNAAGFDYTEATEWVDEWMAPGERKQMAADLGLDRADTKALVASPYDWLQADDRYLDPVVDHAFNRRWVAYLIGPGATVYKKAEAILRIFGRDRL